MRFQFSAIAVACGALLAACGGGGSGSKEGGAVQSLSFPFPGGAMVAIPPAGATTATLAATASSGGPVTYTSNTPDVCTVSGATLSLLKAGECSVTATQAGYQDYAPVSQSQLFVVPKNPQLFVKFTNPGWQPVGGTPVQLSATLNSGLPVTFESKTPALCSVSGSTLTPLANGMCTVTATQAGNDIYAATKADKNIPIGTEKPVALNFVTGYKDGGATKEGLIGHPGNQWWCQDCDPKASSDGNSFTFTASWGAPPKPGDWDYNSALFTLFGFNLEDADLYSPGGWYRGGVKASAFSTTSLVRKGVQIDIQGAMHFNLAQNPEWYGSTNNKFNVELFLAHFNPNKKDSDGNVCNVMLKATVQPTSDAATDYSVGLKDQFAISEACGLSGLDIWNELQTYPIVGIKFSAAKSNSDKANASGQYQNKFTLTGPIYFQ